MPKTDPITGCQVMTQAEFWASEARREGKGRSGGDLMADFFEELAQEERNEEDRLRTPEGAKAAFNSELETVRSYAQDMIRLARKHGDEPDVWELREASYPLVEEVLEVLEAEFSGSFKTTSVRLVARCTRSGGVEDVLEMEMEYFSGDFYEPPNSDGSIEWKGLPHE